MKNLTKSYDEHYPRVYAAMKRAGHDAFHALRILVQAHRGDKHTIQWIKAVRRL